jgi:mediator of RNA polymerase II transcription subunit 13
VYYVICPSSDPDVVLQTILVACQSIGHNIAASEKQKKLNISSQKQQGSALPDDSASIQYQGVVGFSTSRLVLQVLTAEMIMKLTNPGSVHFDSLKEVAFSVYNKIRRIPRLSSNTEMSVPNNQSGRNRPISLQSSSAISGMWKDSGTGRSSGPTNVLPVHESLLDSSSFRPNNWDSPWQHQGTSNELSILDNSKFLRDTLRYLFEPVFILAEPGSLDCGVGFSPSRPAGLDESSAGIHPGSSEAVHGMVADSGFDDLKGANLKVANLHCCYGWTEDWQWLLSVWTDARGELFDVHLFPVSSGSGFGNRFEVKGLQDLFIQVLLHGCQLMTMATATGTAKPRAMIITRIGPFFEIECQGKSDIDLFPLCKNIRKQ